jgi:hypothetical protein
MAKHKEGKVEDYFKEQVAAHGGTTRKAKWLCRRGCPDQFWTFPKGLGGSNGIGFAEIKAPGLPLAPHQDREIEKLKAVGVTVYVLDSFEAVDHFIRREA